MPYLPAPRIRLKGAARRESLGITVPQIAETSRTRPVMPPIKDITPAAKLAHEEAVAAFDETLSELPSGSIRINGVDVTTFDQIIDAKLPFPSIGVIQAFIRSYVDGAQGKKAEKISKSTLERRVISLFAAWRRRTFELAPPGIRGAAMRYTKHVCLEKGLVNTPADRPQLTTDTIFAMQEYVFSKYFDHPLLAVMYVTLFSSLAIHTASRPNPVVSINGKNVPDKKSGCCFREFDIWRLHAGKSQANILLGHFGPRHSKTSTGKNCQQPLQPGPSALTSPLDLVLIILYLREIIDADTYRSYYDSDTVPEHKAAPVRLPDSCLSEHVFELKGRILKTQWMTDKLVEISIGLGFETLVRSYDFRHMSTQYLARAGVSMTVIKRVLKHAQNSHSTGIYIGPEILFDVRTGTTGGIGTALPKATALPNPAAVLRLTTADKKRIRAGPDVQNKENEYKRLKASSDKTDPDAMRVVKQAESAFRYAAKKAEKQEVKAHRARVLEEQRTSGPSAPVVTADPTPMTTARRELFELLTKPITSADTVIAALERAGKETNKKTPTDDTELDEDENFVEEEGSDDVL